MHKAPKRVSSGVYLDLANLSPLDISLVDINTSLNYLYRFTGHYKDKAPLTVAQHLKLAHRLAETLFPDDYVVQFDTAIHDFPESYTGDIATPLKKLFGEGYKAYEDNVEHTVYSALWCIWPKFTREVYDQRKICDLLALDIERRSMWRDQQGKDHWPNIPMEGIFSVKEKQKIFDEIQSERLIDLIDLYDWMVEKNGGKVYGNNTYEGGYNYRDPNW